MAHAFPRTSATVLAAHSSLSLPTQSTPRICTQCTPFLSPATQLIKEILTYHSEVGLSLAATILIQPFQLALPTLVCSGGRCFKFLYCVLEDSKTRPKLSESHRWLGGGKHASHCKIRRKNSAAVPCN